MKREIRLIMLTCIMKRTDEEELELQELIKGDIDWSWVIGQLIRHRLDGYFYNFISNQKHDYLNRHIDKSLKFLSLSYEKINKSNLEFMQVLFKKLKEEKIKAAGLKGLVFNTSIYGLRNRRSNDIDLLMCEKDLIKFDNIMREFGFIQSLDQGKSEATKRQKLIQLMNYHDLVPYYKKVDDPLIGRIKIDINFQFDAKGNEITEDIIDFGLQTYSANGYIVQGLRWETHIIHLCVHFYREATNSLWVNHGCDLDLYKIVDIENTLRQFTDEQLLSLYIW